MEQREPTADEFTIICGARSLVGARSVLVGIGRPNMAALLAKRVHSPDLVLVYESGVVDSAPDKLPLSIGDPSLVKGAASITSMVDLFAYYVAPGRIDVGFVGGAQVDRRGHVNATVIGGYDDPTARLPGSGGASDIALGVRKLVVMTRHERRRLVGEVDFITAQVAEGAEEVVVTDLAVMSLTEGELRIESLHPGVSRDQVRAATGWDIEVADGVPTTAPATDTELEALRTLDPEHLYTLG